QREIRLHVTGDRAAENICEHRREQQRLERDVKELLGIATHLLQGAPRHRQRLAHGFAQARIVARLRDHRVNIDLVRLGRRAGYRTHRATSIWGASSAAGSSALVSCPVMAINTSSRLGLATLTDVMLTPAWRRSMSTSAASSALSMATYISPDSGLSDGSLPSRARISSPARAWFCGSAIWTCSVDTPTDIFSSSAVPSATLIPRSMTAIRSAS